jgi:hypothetical protein
MSDSKNQHYIPQSYLRNFAHEVRKKGNKEEYYVYVRYKGEKFHSVNVRNICSETYFYTLPDVDEQFKNFIETSYAEKIDVLYPQVNEIVSNDALTIISEPQRASIIVACITLYFRTPKFFAIIEEQCNLLVETLKRFTLGQSEKHLTSFLYREIDLRNLDYEKVSYDWNHKQRAFILREHYRCITDFLRFKQNAGIGISKIVDDSEFITSDNPVVIRNSKTGEFYNLYDPDNIIMLPINSKYLISIQSNSETSLANSFNRILSDYLQAITVNIDIERNSEQWIIGSKRSVHGHITDQQKYNEINPENIQRFLDMKNRAMLLSAFDGLLKSKGYTIDQEVVSKFVEISKNPLMKDDQNVKRVLEEFRKDGWI